MSIFIFMISMWDPMYIGCFKNKTKVKTKTHEVGGDLGLGFGFPCSFAINIFSYFTSDGEWPELLHNLECFPNSI